MSVMQLVLPFFACIGTYTIVYWLLGVMAHRNTDRRHREFLSRVSQVPGAWVPGVPGPPGVPVTAEMQAVIDDELASLRRLELDR